jgi:hypothetical protein
LQKVRNPLYKYASPVVRIPKSQVQNIWNLTTDLSINTIAKHNTASLEIKQLAPVRTDTNSGPVSGEKVLSLTSMGMITGPYGTADNTYSTADANPEAPGFTGDITQQMDWRADCDPSFQFITRASPRSFGYSAGYLTGDGEPPNGEQTGAGIAFPANPQVGDYFLRIDYLPQILYRWDGIMWIRISKNVRTETGMTEADKSQLSRFINNQGYIFDNNTQSIIPERQPLSSLLQLAPDNLPPEE